MLYKQLDDSETVLLWLFMLSIPMRTIRYAPKQVSRNILKVAGMLTRRLKISMNVQHLQKAEMLIRLHWIYCHITGCWKTVRPTISRLTILLMKHWLSLPTTILIQWWTDTRKAVCFYRNRHHLFFTNLAIRKGWDWWIRAVLSKKTESVSLKYWNHWRMTEIPH